MISRIQFFKLGYTPINRQYPIGIFEDGYWIEGIKCTEDLVQDIVIPTELLTNRDYDVCKIDDRVYWITGYKAKTLKEDSIIVSLEYNSVSSLINTTNTLTGTFNKTPMDLMPYSDINFSEDALKRKRIIPLNNTYYQTHYGESRPLFFVQIVSTNNNNLNSYYILCTDIEHGLGVYTQYDDSVGETEDDFFISLYNIMNNTEEALGIAANTIIDVSISIFSPYIINEEIRGERHNYGFIGAEGAIIYPKNKTSGYGCYYKASDFFAQSVNFKPTVNRKNISLSLSSKERHMGQIIVTSHSNNLLATIPKQIVNDLYCYTYCDNTGIYTIVDTAYNELRITIPQGKLPWVGSVWSNYQAQSLEGDRAEMNHAKDMANVQLVANIAQGATNGAMSGGIGGAAAGPVGAVAGAAASVAGSMVSAAAQYHIATSTAEFNFKNNKYRAQTAAAINFNTGYGSDYIESCLTTGGDCVIVLDSVVSEDDFNNHVKTNGYPAPNKLITVDVNDGYYQGVILDNLKVGTDKLSMLVSEFRSGVLLKSINKIIAEPLRAYDIQYMNEDERDYDTRIIDGFASYKGLLKDKGLRWLDIEWGYNGHVDDHAFTAYNWRFKLREFTNLEDGIYNCGFLYNTYNDDRTTNLYLYGDGDRYIEVIDNEIWFKGAVLRRNIKDIFVYYLEKWTR